MNGNGTGKAVGAIINKTKQNKKRSVTGLEDKLKKFTQISLITVG